MTVWEVVSEINVNDYYIMSYIVFVTLVTAKNIKPCNVRIRARVSRDVISLPPELGHCTPSSF